MFGHHKRKRERRQIREEKESLNKQRQQMEQAPKEEAALKEEASRQAQKAKEDRAKSRQEGREYAEEVLSRDVQGLSPKQRQAMQESAQHRLNRDLQGHQRNLLAKQGRQGIKGGAAYAQQADLARLGTEAQGQYQRDIANLDSDLAMKKLAAMFNIEQGEAAQGQLDRQTAIDELRLDQERKRQRMLEEQYNRIFNRI